MNDLGMVCRLFDWLAANRLPASLAGGWAEELHGMAAPRPHQDVDLLYLAGDFSRLDALREPGVVPVTAKRFSHKRAVLWEDVLVEFLLVEARDDGWQTNFFSGRFVLRWPKEPLTARVWAGKREISAASPAALRHYRQMHRHIEDAYLAYQNQKQG